MIIDREHCDGQAAALGDTNDCTVRACAVALQIDYVGVHDYLRDEYGRKHRKGLHSHVYHAALESLGATLTKLKGPDYAYGRIWVEGHDRWSRNGNYYWVEGTYRTVRRKIAGSGEDYTAATVKTLAKELPAGTYLVNTPSHVLCLRDGEVHDWTDGRANRIEAVYRVEC